MIPSLDKLVLEKMNSSSEPAQNSPIIPCNDLAIYRYMRDIRRYMELFESFESKKPGKYLYH